MQYKRRVVHIGGTYPLESPPSIRTPYLTMFVFSRRYCVGAPNFKEVPPTLSKSPFIYPIPRPPVFAPCLLIDWHVHAHVRRLLVRPPDRLPIHHICLSARLCAGPPLSNSPLVRPCSPQPLSAQSRIRSTACPLPSSPFVSSSARPFVCSYSPLFATPKPRLVRSHFCL